MGDPFFWGEFLGADESFFEQVEIFFCQVLG
jgi:hypothetical protein